MMRVSLTEHFVATSLTCPHDVRRIEYVSKTVPGFFVEVRRSRQNYGTYYFRGKDIHGKTFTQKISRTDEMSFSDAENTARRLKSEQYLKLSSGVDPRSMDPVKQTVPTLNDFYLSDYLPFIKQRNRSWKSTNGVYTRYVKPRFGSLRFSDISRAMVIDFHAELKQRGLAGATADHGLKTLRHIINTAVLNGVATDNPATKVPLFNDFNEVNNVPSPDQFRKLMTVLNSSPSQIALIARMLILTGCRLSELLSATWSNCDLEKHVLYIESKRGGPR
jgi:hypothetical protein